MTKMQKVWLGIFLAMFIVPEVLWSPVYKFWYSLKLPTVGGHYAIVRQNFLDNSGNSDLWSNLILLEFFGLLLTAIYLVVIRKSFTHRWLTWALSLVFLLASLYVLWTHALSTINIKIL
jgi:hypothetical protein